jgi:thiol-disulfide isomerase/thioredoxin
MVWGKRYKLRSVIPIAIGAITVKKIFMKRSFFIAAVLCVMAGAANAQAQYEISTAERHSGQKVLTGIINKYLVMNDASYQWYKANQTAYSPDTSILTAMEKVKGKVQFVVFGGTWCEDTQFILPKFFKLQEMTGVSDAQVSFFGVNEAKKSLSHIAEAFGITNVPTIIVMKDGKETGRVVEYGKTGKWDVELAGILSRN